MLDPHVILDEPLLPGKVPQRDCCHQKVFTLALIGLGYVVLVPLVTNPGRWGQQHLAVDDHGIGMVNGRFGFRVTSRPAPFHAKTFGMCPRTVVAVNSARNFSMQGSPYEEPFRQAKNPSNVVKLAFNNFNRQFGGLVDQVAEFIPPDDSETRAPDKFGFTLSNDGITERERRMGPPGPLPAPRAVQIAYDVLIFFLDRVFEGRAIERFWFLETVARMPYFSYVTVLHLYETLGFWRTGELRMVHNAEEWNELHHLLIMESLGGNRRWWVRFLAQHSAIAYYWFLVLGYLVSPQWSYKFSEMLETHAVNTYAEFVDENREKLKELPPPDIAVYYYKTGDLYLFDLDSSMVRGGEDPRRPPVENLLDVFKNIRDDEWEHVKTMVCCQDYSTLENLPVGANPMQQKEAEFARQNREAWELWASKINAYKAGAPSNNEQDKNGNESAAVLPCELVG